MTSAARPDRSAAMHPLPAAERARGTVIHGSTRPGPCAGRPGRGAAGPAGSPARSPAQCRPPRRTSRQRSRMVTTWRCRDGSADTARSSWSRTSLDSTALSGAVSHREAASMEDQFRAARRGTGEPVIRVRLSPGSQRRLGNCPGLTGTTSPGPVDQDGERPCAQRRTAFEPGQAAQHPQPSLLDHVLGGLRAVNERPRQPEHGRRPLLHELGYRLSSPARSSATRSVSVQVTSSAW